VRFSAFAISTGYDGTWSSANQCIGYIESRIGTSASAPILAWTGSAGDLYFTTFDPQHGQVTVATVTPARTQTDYVRVDMAMKLNVGSRSYEYCFRVDNVVVASGTASWTSGFGGTENRIELIGLGPFEYTVSGTYHTAMLYDDVYIGEVAAPVTDCFLGDVAADFLRPTADGTYQDWPDTTPGSTSPTYTLVDDTEWDRTTYIQARANYPTGTNFSAKPKATYVHQSAPSAAILAAQVFCTGGSTASPNALDDLQVSPILYDGSLVYTAHGVFPSERNLPWRMDLGCLTHNPFTRTSWTAAAINSMEVGVQVMGYEPSAGGDAPRVTQLGIEVLYPTAILRSIRSWAQIVG
jgi:hypothetical protein